MDIVEIKVKITKLTLVAVVQMKDKVLVQVIILHRIIVSIQLFLVLALQLVILAQHKDVVEVDEEVYWRIT